jgi:hypothetical protein
MIENDPFLRVQAQLAAQEYVMKIMIQMMSQLAPNSGIQAAMHQMLDNSVKAANINTDDPAQTEALRQYVHNHGRQIIDAGFGARPASKP